MQPVNRTISNCNSQWLSLAASVKNYLPTAPLHTLYFIYHPHFRAKDIRVFADDKRTVKVHGNTLGEFI
jgi:hypothetical protein